MASTGSLTQSLRALRCLVRISLTPRGRRLIERICQEAREVGYTRIYLDTLASMKAAIKLYDALGFKPVGPYVFNPNPGAVFLGREL